jgi:hypothetical protein
MKSSKPRTPRAAKAVSSARILEPMPPEANGVNHTASEDEIRLLAYHKWVSAGRPECDGAQFWHEAEMELRR